MSVLSGFADADAWTYRADGAIVGRARNSSWAEKVRAGVPIDCFMEMDCGCCCDDDIRTPPTLSPTLPRDALFEPAPRMPKYHADDSEDTEPADFDAYFEDVEPRHIARARRCCGSSRSSNKKTAKPPKYGPKASKARTIAASVLAEPVAPSGHLTRDETEDYCFVCGSPQSTYLMNADTLSKARACDHCSPAFKAELVERDRLHTLVAETVAAQREFALRWLTVGVLYMEWLNDLADFADDAGIEEPTEEDLELERQLQRQRDARYER
jgi:hypothetical protein